MAFSESDLKWIREHGGVVGTVSESEAARLEREYAERQRQQAAERQRQAAAERERQARQAAIRDSQSATGSFTATPAPRVATPAPKPAADLFAGATARAGVGPQIITPEATRPQPVKTTITTVAAKTVLLPFRNEGGTYDLEKAIESKLVPTKTMQDAGFSDKQITAAINAAMKDNAAKHTADIAKAVGASVPIAEKISISAFTGAPARGGVSTGAAAFSGSTAKAGIGVYQPKTKLEALALGAMPGAGQFQATFSDALTKLEKYVGRGAQDTSKASKALRLAGGLGAGIAIAALSPVAIVDTMLASSGISGKKRAAKEMAIGMKDYFVSLPVAFSADPYYTVGEVAGMIGGGKAVVKAARTARVWADPYGVPARTVGIEFSVSKIPTGKTVSATTMANMGKALAKAQKDVMSGKLSGTATAGGVTIKYRGSPLQHTIGGVVMHATPDVSALIKNPKLVVGPEGMYFSPHLAPRFMASSAAGTVAVRPGVVAVLTDASKVRTPPTAALGKLAKGTGGDFILHADKGLWSPSKLYKYAFENEIVGSPNTSFTKTVSTLRARLLGDKAGDLLIQYSGPDAPGIKNGQLVPLHIFADKGVFRAPPTPAALYAAKLTTIWEALKDVGVKVRHPLSGNKTFKITGNALADQIALTKALKDTATKVATDKVPSGTGVKFDTAYRRALTVEYAKLTRTMNTTVSAAAARAYAKEPGRFEAAYSQHLTENLNNVARAASREQAYSDVRAATGRTRSVSERQLPDWQRAEREGRTTDRQRTRAESARERTRADKQRERSERDAQREREITPREREREVPPREREAEPPREREAPPREREATPPREREREVPPRDRTERPPVERPPREKPPRERPPRRPPVERPPTRRPPRGEPPPPEPPPERPPTRPPTVPPTTTLRPPGRSPITLTQQQYAGVVGWRQGIFYILAYPPYGKQHIVYTRKPIPGIQYARGPESPQRSATLVGGKLPRAFEVAMGATKVRVQPHKTSRTPRLTFTARKEARPRIGEIRK